MTVQEFHDGVGNTTCNVITRASRVKWKGGGPSEDYQNYDV